MYMHSNKSLASVKLHYNHFDLSEELKFIANLPTGTPVRQHISVVFDIAQQNRQQSIVPGAVGSDSGSGSGDPAVSCLPQPEFHHSGATTARLA